MGKCMRVAQGPVSVGGFLASGRAASAQQNFPTVGRIPGGAIVEAEARGEIVCNGRLRLLLKRPDFTTAQAIARAINQKFPESAVTLDAGTVEVAIPPEKRGNVVGFAGEIGLLEVAPDAVAVVVINERTGTVCCRTACQNIYSSGRARQSHDRNRGKSRSVATIAF
jgi:flagellar P-ring protein precursor FlgI